LVLQQALFLGAAAAFFTGFAAFLVAIETIEHPAGV
jgi:hypothetical protein